MKLKNKLILGISSLSIVAVPTVLLASCTTSSSDDDHTHPEDNIPPGNNIPPEGNTPPGGNIPPEDNAPPDTSTPEEPKPQPIIKPTTSKKEINNSTLGFKQTVEKNAFKINKQWILDNKTKLLEGDTSLFIYADDISKFSAKPLKEDETKLDINFTLKPGKSRIEDNQISTQHVSYRVIVNGFDLPTRTLETLSELLNNFITPKIQPKKFIVPEDKFIRIHEKPSNGSKTQDPTTTWITNKYPENNRGISLGSSTGPDCIWVPYGWNQSQSNSSESDVWNWLENYGIPNGDLYSYINNLLKDYNYFSAQHELKSIYFYSQLQEYNEDEKTDKSIWVYRKKYAPIGWGFRVNNNGSENTTINDGITIPSDGDYIKNSYISNETNFDFGYKWQYDGNPGDEETVNFTPNYYQEFRQGDYSFNMSGEIISYKGNEKNLVIPNSFNINGKEIFVKKIGKSVFENKGIETVKLPSKLEIIGENAFHQNNLKVVDLPNTVKNIQRYAFRKNKLQRLELPNSLTHIGIGGFEHNPAIGDLIIPNSILEIAEWAFATSGLTSITFQSNSKLEIIKEKSFAYCGNLTSEIVIPNSVKQIQFDSFIDSKITSLKFEENSQLTRIDANAFKNNNIGSEINIPSSVEIIEDGAFLNNPNIAKIIIHKEFSNINNWKDSNVIVEQRSRRK